MTSLKKTFDLINQAKAEVVSVAKASLENQMYDLVREASYLAGDIDQLLERHSDYANKTRAPVADDKAGNSATKSKAANSNRKAKSER